MASTVGTGSHCGACKFLRRKCTPDCVFAPYFCSEQGPARFAAIHKVFGASNASKLLHQVADADRSEAVATIGYEAQARINDPVYGCVGYIFTLQQQVAWLQAQVIQARAQLAQECRDSRINTETQWSPNMSYQNYMNAANFMNFNTSPQSSMDSVDHSNEGMPIHYDHGLFEKRLSESDLGELQELAVRMMRN
ncbi:LOB domain-containing protein 16-like [Bidens hawaiensis]|uniref:LOB domain-containing protein 16-like n=1 Tax=Bidens hawaiensis TaxID=980011 RepID=UPI00404BA3C4